MEKIYFDDETYIWKTKFDISHMKDNVLEECFIIIDMEDLGMMDAFGFFSEGKENIDFNGNFEVTKKIHEIVKEGINLCIILFNENIKSPYNKINTEAWINVVRANNPTQKISSAESELVMHNHTDLNRMYNKFFIPDYTYVHYVQMPDNLEGNDGVLFIEGKDGIIYNILPKENDIIIMEGRVPHVPAAAGKSTKDRIVIAGNVGFEMIKKINTLI
jgi:hypothetical protein